jgi:putative transposase
MFERFAMSIPLPLRSDFDGPMLRKLARGSRDPDQTRRLLALAEIYDGGSRSDAVRIGGVTLQIVRDWVIRFNAKGVS